MGFLNLFINLLILISEVFYLRVFFLVLRVLGEVTGERRASRKDDKMFLRRFFWVVRLFCLGGVVGCFFGIGVYSFWRMFYSRLLKF